MITVLLILHGLVGVALLGAVTHQAFAALGRVEARTGSFFKRFRTTDAAAYANAVAVLFVLASVMGAILYPNYRTQVRPLLQDMDLRGANGAFELKEHFSALALVLLPAYWAAWRQPLVPEYASLRFWLTWMIALVVWWNFLVGDVLSVIKGLFP
jgi:hypothetical protein